MAGGSCWNRNPIPFPVFVGSLSCWRGTRDPRPAALPGTPEALRIAHERITAAGAAEIKNLPANAKSKGNSVTIVVVRGRSEDARRTQLEGKQRAMITLIKST